MCCGLRLWCRHCNCNARGKPVCLGLWWNGADGEGKVLKAAPRRCVPQWRSWPGCQWDLGGLTFLLYFQRLAPPWGLILGSQLSPICGHLYLSQARDPWNMIFSADWLCWNCFVGLLCLLPESGSRLLGVSLSGFSGTLVKTTLDLKVGVSLQKGVWFGQDTSRACGACEA